ncbi:MAG: chemotaxis response regulator protein-glutamate methylesterase [Alphaproteobacteria bacterium]|nr:chemotaxis response regulator protein-glutamate methylesterase [Alphaproteobacteria bacterium]
MAIASEAPATVSATDPIRVMIVDDSVVIRGFLSRFIESAPGLKVAASVSNGQLALNSIERSSFDVVVLDIEMPVMDGMTALPLLLKADPNIQVIIASTLTKENAAITLKAMGMGAAECLAKPTSQELAGGSTIFRDDLVEKVRELGYLARKKRGLEARPKMPGISSAAVAARASIAEKKFTLRKELSKTIPEAIAVGSSTGGPQALLQFFTELKGGFRQPVFVTQHMPPTFTTILAEHIARQSGLTCKEAAEGDVVQAGHVYLAPGNFHMTVKDIRGKKFISINQDAPEGFCRPAVDPMLRSIVNVYGSKVLAVIFTGMGADGLKGCQKVVDAGGAVWAQDEATSVVWGMPGAVAMAGICSRVLPLGKMAAAVREYAGSGGAF